MSASERRADEIDAATQHMMVAAPVLELVGGVRRGLDADLSML